MTQPEPPSNEAFQRLDRDLKTLADSRVRKPSGLVMGAGGGGGGSEDGYRVVAEMIGGVLGGLGLGWVFDRLAHTGPLGLIVGLLVGTAASVFLVVRSAGRMSKAAQAASPPAANIATDDDINEQG